MSSIVKSVDVDDQDSKEEKEKVYNVGTPMYKSPELLEYQTCFDITDINVLKSCDVFSLSIIYWQMMNGYKNYPFKLCKYGNKCSDYDPKYKFIKHKKYNQFWDIHKNCNMNINDRLLLCKLFESMFEYNPHERISIDKILSHEWVVSNESNPLFNMNNFQLETFVRDIFHKTKGKND